MDKNKYLKMNEFDRWFNDGGDIKYRYDYDLNSKSLVFDVGGYEGNFSQKIIDKFSCKVFIFEPMKSYYNLIEKRFSTNDNVILYNFGLSKLTEDIKIFHSDDASSMFKESESYEIINVKNITDFIKESNISKIDLLKLNIEGSEYDVLEKLIEDDLIGIIDNIQVQFHSFIDNCVYRRDNIRKHLRETHYETYCYDFVWENWKKIDK
jgi:FkbM family methyltransferase